MGNRNSQYDRLKSEQKQSQPRPKQHKQLVSNMKTVHFKLHIAVDFGTDGCALAFAYKDKVSVYNKWRAQQIASNSRAATTTKTKTQLILNENNEVTCFGNAAKFTYFNMEPPEKNRKKFFERFKMALYETHLDEFSDIIESDEEQKRSDVNTAKYLYDTNNKRIETKIVFIAAFQMLQRRAKEYIPERITNEHIKDEEIQWIVTVPAIWSEKAKNKMRDWMIEAALIDKHVIDQCVIVYEPDCASLSMQKQYFKDITRESRRRSYSSKSSINVIFNPCDVMESDEDEKDFKLAKKKENFEKNDKYILIDAGGGTVDIACHKILGNGCVEEIVYPTGNKWGSCYIDDLYKKLLQVIFTKQCIIDYKNKSPAGFVEVMVNFQKAKETFYNKKNANTHRVHLPDDFVRFLSQECEKKNTDLSTKINAFGASKQLKYFRDLFWNKKKDLDEKEEMKYDDNSVCVLRLIKERLNDDEDEDEDDYSDSDEECVKWIEYIELDVLIWKCLFDSKINQIISHVEKLLEVEALSDCRFLGLVGGFSCSKYFQYRMQKKFGEYGYYQMTIVIPRKPMLTVVEGAALMAITQFTYMRARKLKYTYGINCACDKESAKKMGISDDYINNQHNIATDGMVKGYFSIVAFKNERVSIGTVKKIIRYRRWKISVIPILKSDKPNPKVASEGEELTILHISHTNSKREVVTEFHFYDTIFKVYSYPKSNPNEKQQVHLKYT